MEYGQYAFRDDLLRFSPSQDLNTQLEISSAQLSEFKEKVAALRQEVSTRSRRSRLRCSAAAASSTLSDQGQTGDTGAVPVIVMNADFR